MFYIANIENILALKEVIETITKDKTSTRQEASITKNLFNFGSKALYIKTLKTAN